MKQPPYTPEQVLNNLGIVEAMCETPLTPTDRRWIRDRALDIRARGIAIRLATNPKHDALAAIAQSVVDEQADGIDRSAWRLTAALKVLRQKEEA